MSKSLGNVIDPVKLVEEYGTDTLRYYLARHIQPFEDSDFTLEKFKDAYNANLANGLGNLVARVMKLAEQYLSSPESLSTEIPPVFLKLLSRFEFNKACDFIWQQIADADLRIKHKNHLS